jgi:hypothetical protein
LSLARLAADYALQSGESCRAFHLATRRYSARAAKDKVAARLDLKWLAAIDTASQQRWRLVALATLGKPLKPLTATPQATSAWRLIVDHLLGFDARPVFTNQPDPIAHAITRTAARRLRRRSHGRARST